MRKLGDNPLTVEVDHKVLRISIGVKEICHAVSYGLEHNYPTFRITDEYGFFLDIANELLREEEDGTTIVHRMLDKAAKEAIEQGTESVEFEEDFEDD